MQSRTSIFKASHHVYILFPKLLRMNIHLFFNLYIFTFSFQWACLTRLTQTPDSRPRWAKRAETCPTPADCACVFVLKHPRETHDHAAISTARSSILCLLCSLPDLQRLCDKWLDVLETFWTDHQPGCSVSCRVAFAAVRGTSCHSLHRLIELHFKAIFLLSWSLLGGSLRALFPHQCLEETFQSTCQIHAWLFFWLNYFYSEKLHFHNTDRECALLRNPYPVSAVIVIEHSFPLTDPHLPAP